jgi:hypothetical protein
VAFDRRVDERLLIEWESPDVSKERETQFLGATGGLDVATVVKHYSPNYPEHTPHAVIAKHDNSVGRGQPVVNGLDVGAVHYPLICTEECLMDCSPLLERRLAPLRSPVVMIERDHLDTSSTAQLARQACLSRSRGSNDGDPLHMSPFLASRFAQP